MKPFISKAQNAITFGIDTPNPKYREGLKKRLPIFELTLWARAMSSVGRVEVFRNTIGIHGSLHVWGWAISFQTRNDKNSKYKSLINFKLHKFFWK